MHPTPDAPTEVIPIPPPPRPRRRGPRRLVAAVLVTAVVVVAGAVLVTRHRAGAQRQPAERTEVTTAKLERRDLSTVRTLPGAIGYGAARPLTGHTAATVTWLPAVGATVKRGRQLFRADDKPVVLFYGSMPLYRPITGENMAGRDVRIVLDNLKALGYATGRQPARKDDQAVLTKDLIAAVKRWQKDLGVPPSGQLAVGDVEVLSGAVRVDAVSVQPGSPANAPLMSVTSTRKVVTVAAELGDAASVERGAAVTVKLPDDRTVKARVTTVGRDLAATAEGGAATAPAKLTVTVTVDDPGVIAKLDSADVDVDFPGRTVRGALAAPIEALVALTEGGYAVQGPAGLVAVRTGMFANGWVELDGAGLTEGTDVVVSS
ncbi:peptidoglycan-binding protein [Paractinoplanes ferrugineus]|uniref:Peptidoglycan-binding protein n=1 Tax=Paractinoplanes ferrugineus TaxID=113564 RepID=A0A919J8V4_9ACTN|nr:efflux RND transporter periplasmic adaptor subunit [Actinoplanes ferrugineus]GIE16675.1 peptidoglycan-binding protein [Actinoplanes ferrugineus]